MVHRRRGDSVDEGVRARQGLDFDHGSCRGGGGCRVGGFRVVMGRGWLGVLCQTVLLFMRPCFPRLVICPSAIRVMQHARVVHPNIGRVWRCYARGDVRAHPSESSLDPYALKVIGAHTDKTFPRKRLAKDLVV